MGLVVLCGFLCASECYLSSVLDTVKTLIVYLHCKNGFCQNSNIQNCSVDVTVLQIFSPVFVFETNHVALDKLPVLSFSFL